MSNYADRLHAAFNDFAANSNRPPDALHHIYDDSYVFLTESFEKAKAHIYREPGDQGPSLKMDQDMDDALAADLQEDVADYFEIATILSANPPANFGFENDDVLKNAFKESLMLVQSHLDEHFCYRPLKLPVFGAYYDTDIVIKAAINDL